MNSVLRSVLALLMIVSGFTVNYIALAADASHPFRMSTEINAVTIDAMGKKQPGKEVANDANKADVPAIQAKVIESLQADDFSYLYVQSNSSKIWIAGIKVNAKVGDTINYIENVRMDNFFSKTLNRTFKQVVFVSSVSVIK